MEYICGGIVVVFLIVVAANYFQEAAADRARIAKEMAFRNAKQAYAECLQSLKKDPANPDLRQEALSLGRAYSDMTRNHGGVTVFDELALKNDLDAACAGSAVRVDKGSIEERLAKLQKLFAAGHITDDELRTRRRDILNDV